MSSQKPITFSECIALFLEQDESWANSPPIRWRPRSYLHLVTVWPYEDNTKIEYHYAGLPVVVLHEDGVIKLRNHARDWAGIRNRMNDMLRPLGWSVFQFPVTGEWKVKSHWHKERPYLNFEDGMMLDPTMHRKDHHAHP